MNHPQSSLAARCCPFPKGVGPLARLGLQGSPLAGETPAAAIAGMTKGSHRDSFWLDPADFEPFV